MVLDFPAFVIPPSIASGPDPTASLQEQELKSPIIPVPSSNLAYYYPGEDKVRQEMK